jgi:O-antigen ligase
VLSGHAGDGRNKLYPNRSWAEVTSVSLPNHAAPDWPERVALGATLLTPLFLMHGHALADATITITDLCFLFASAQRRAWGWLREGWTRLGLAWWGWILICSLPLPALGLGEGKISSMLQALATLRFIIFLPALRHMVLREAAPRRWLAGVLAACTAYITTQVFIQGALGHTLYGDRPGAAGELGGPFNKPRAGPPLARLIPPVLVPPVQALLNRPRLLARLGGLLLLLVPMAAMVLIGQRMPLVLTGFGLLISALLLPRLRPAVLIAGVVALGLVAATVVVRPSAYHRLVVQFSSQLEHFSVSPYGQIYTRAAEIAVQHPWTGRGFDGFRSGCRMPRYFHASLDGSQPDGGGAAICTEHPHNFYAQAVTDGGFPGLALFCALAVSWLAALWRGLPQTPDPRRVGLFASAVIQLWPLASTSGFTSMPMGGWFFLLLGWGLAEAPAARR